jgi:hypothetical protein
MLPTDVFYLTVGADADINGNGRIDGVSLSIDPFGETRGLRSEVNGWFSLFPPDVFAAMINVPYQFLRQYAAVQLETRTLPDGLVVWNSAVPVPVEGDGANDTLVSAESAMGPPEAPFISIGTYRDDEGRNHASVADGAMAREVVPYIQFIDTLIGDWR